MFKTTGHVLKRKIRLEQKEKCRSKNKLCLFTTQSRLITTLKEQALENTMEKGENAGNQHYLLFPRCFLLYQREKLSF